MTTRTVIEIVAPVEPASLSLQLESAMVQADDSKLRYDVDTLSLTSFDTDVPDPVLVRGEGEAWVSFYETGSTTARLHFEIRRQSGAMGSDELEPALVHLTIREFGD